MATMMRAAVLLVLTALVAVLWVVNCTGPRPAVSDIEVTTPSEPGQPYLVAAIVRNQGFGHGQVQVTFRLRDRASGQNFEKEEKATLDQGEMARVVAEIHAPPGDYAPDVAAEYPPR